jgi:phosphoribosyl 1,2-cyclic phosphodiesterase
MLTHEHDDHVRGLAAARKYRIPLISTSGTARALGVQSALLGNISFHEPIERAGLEIRAIATSHDAAQPCGYSFSDGATRVTLLTDLGATSDDCAELVAASQLIVIEANHDLQMLKSGPYPEHLKRRVLSSVGHLSNDDCGRFLIRCLGTGAASRTIWLAHLSATNNKPALAVRTVQEKLLRSRFPHRISALPRREVGPTWQPSPIPLVAQLGLFD